MIRATLLLLLLAACAPVSPAAMRQNLGACAAGELRPIYECWRVREPGFDYHARPTQGEGLGR
jgi:hypothetical protein